MQKDSMLPLSLVMTKPKTIAQSFVRAQKYINIEELGLQKPHIESKRKGIVEKVNPLKKD